MNKIPFSQENDIVTALPQGISKTKKWIIRRGKNKLFLKETINTKGAVTKQEIENINRQCDCFLPIIDQQSFDEKKYTLYPFLKGRKFESFTLQEVKKIAEKIGCTLSNLSKCKVDYPEMNLSKIKELFLQDVEFFFSCRKSPFDISKEEFIKEGLECLKSFQHAGQTLIHGDIKPENLIIAKNKIYFIDLDEMRKGYFAFNFQFTCQMLFFKSKKYSTFFKTLILSYFNNTIPLWFSENYKFMLYNKFFNRARLFIEKDDKVGEKLFYDEFRHIFNLIRKKDWQIC